MRGLMTRDIPKLSREFDLFSQRRARTAGKHPPAPTKREFSARLRDALFIDIQDGIGPFDSSYSYIAGDDRPTALWKYYDRSLFKESEEYHKSRCAKAAWMRVSVQSAMGPAKGRGHLRVRA